MAMHRRSALRRCAAADPSPARHLRASRTIVIGWDQDQLVACNFLTRQVIGCTPDLVEFLSDIDDWQPADELLARYPGVEPDTLSALVQATMLIEADTEIARREDEYRANWTWGLPAAALHFCVQDSQPMTLEEGERTQIAKSKTEPSPRLHIENRGRFGRVIPFAQPDRSGLLEIMSQRRTVRECDSSAIIGRETLGECLFAGLGINGWTSNSVAELPLSMTPSGGARNPFEAYIVAVRVAGLAPGLYHYSAAEHSLGFMAAARVDLAELFAGQEWARTMTCAVILSAALERTMWKYSDPNAYRVVMIEAGHIGQNIMLAATDRGLTACPTAALNHSLIRELFGLGQITDAPTYALLIGAPLRN
jgi:SagB-type dehydrogenase family enzyme